MSTTLDTADFKTVWNDDFQTSNGINGSIFPVQWGSGFSSSSAGLTSVSNGSASGFMQADNGKTAGDGYGLYSATFTMPTAQENTGGGAYICLWPGTNAWPGPEIDFVEQGYGGEYATVHWAGTNGANDYKSTEFSANLSQPTTVAVDWEAGSLTYYVNGQELVSFAAGGSVPVPKDAADGGQNESFGFGNSGAKGATATVLDMSYSARVSTAASTAPTGGSTVTGKPVTSPVVPVVPPVAPIVPVTPTAPTSIAFVISSVTEANGHLTIAGDKETGAAQTIRATVDGKYLGTMEDGAKDGKFSFNVADPLAAGSHTALLTLDGSSVTAKLTFITGSTSTAPAAPVAPVTTPPAPVTPAEPVTSSGAIDVLSMKELAGQLQMSMSGPGGTLRETLDGAYKGTLWDNMPSGSHTFTMGDVSVGTHSMGLSIDGTSHTDTIVFAKSAAGVFSIASQHAT